MINRKWKGRKKSRKEVSKQDKIEGFLALMNKGDERAGTQAQRLRKMRNACAISCAFLGPLGPSISTLGPLLGLSFAVFALLLQGRNSMLVSWQLNAS